MPAKAKKADGPDSWDLETKQGFLPDPTDSESTHNKGQELTAKEVADAWAEKQLTEQPKALDSSLFGIKQVAVKQLEAAITAIDAAYLLVWPTSYNNKDSFLTVLGDARDDVAQAVVSLGSLG